MCVLESQAQQFYEQLANSPHASEPLKAIASLIAQDEVEHADYLKHVLFCYNADVEKWRSRMWLASLGLIVDMWKVFFKIQLQKPKLTDL